jgi:hypothetical protein
MVSAGLDTWPRHAGDLLGVEYNNIGIGGSGYIASAANGADFRSRIPDMIQAKPDILVIFGGYNDAALANYSQINAEALYVLRAAMALPTKPIVIATGPWLVNHNVTVPRGVNASPPRVCP